MNHRDKKQLIDILLGSANAGVSAAVTAHLEECKECAETMESLKIIAHESDNSSIVPPEHLKNSLFLSPNKSYKPVYNKKESLISALKVLLRPTSVAVAAVVIAAVAISSLYLNKEHSALNAAMKLTLLHGNLVYNNAILDKKTTEINPGHIRTENDSAASLALETALSISISENTDMSVISAQEITEKESKKYTASLEMKSGQIMVLSNHDVIKKYTISTPYAVFEPIGTGFILSTDNISSRLSVLEGMVRVTYSGGKEIILNKDDGCEINRSFKKSKIDSKKAVETFNKKFQKRKTKRGLSHENIQQQDSSGNENTGYSKEADNISGDNAEVQMRENAAKELRENKSDIRNESRQIQKEMRSDRKSGKGSQR
jgi:hypothetical protein